MARWEFKLPDIGEGITEGEVVSWLVKPGDVVKEDQPMVEVMTDKATVTITSPKAGTIVELFGKVGDVVKVHSSLVAYELENSGAAADSHGGASTHGGTSTASTSPQGAPSPSMAAEPTAKSVQGPAATAVGDIRENLPGMSMFQGAGGRAASSAVVGASAAGVGVASAAGAEAGTGAFFQEKPLATPATRKLARDLEVDLKRVPPTGPNGRVTKDDVARFRGGAPSVPVSGAAATAVRGSAGTSARTSEVAQQNGHDSQASPALEDRTPFVGIRRKIAERMSTSKRTAAHFTFVEECDCTALKALRERVKGKAEKEGVKLTYLAFVARAVIAAIKRHPTLNSTLDETTNELVVRRYVNLGIATSTDAGLVVPVVKDADRRSILDLAREIARLGKSAKDGKLKPHDLTGSTFTITSLGQQGGLFATPIINFPEVAILGVHQMKQKPVVRDGQIVIGDVMLLSLSFDHRIIDGHIGAAFAYEVIDFLQDPDRLLLEV